jgi:cholesterol transport system auxiliary component
MRPLVIALLALILLGACASAPGIPDTIYHRLPEPVISPLPAPLTPLPVLVEAFQAGGLHADQALLYSLDPDGRQLLAYHYQRWVDPPSRLLQRRLIQTLQDSGAAAVVTDRLPARADALRIQGRIHAFERIQQADGWEVSVAFSLRADSGRSDLPLLAKDYRVRRSAGGNSMASTTSSLGAAIDQVFTQFLRDLAAAQRE